MERLSYDMNRTQSTTNLPYEPPIILVLEFPSPTADEKMSPTADEKIRNHNVVA